MTDKLDQFEVHKEVSLLIDSLAPSERREVMVALAERFGFKLTDKTTGTSRGPRAGYGRKRSH